MKCNMCVGQNMEEYRVESPPLVPVTVAVSTTVECPSISIEEIREFDGENSVKFVPKQTNLLLPLEVITEEGSDLSDVENMPVPKQPIKPLKKKKKQLLSKLFSGKQEETHCVLVDAKIVEESEECRSICTTETLDAEMEVEVINLDSNSNSSSTCDLTEGINSENDIIEMTEAPDCVESTNADDDDDDDDDDDNKINVNTIIIPLNNNNDYRQPKTLRFLCEKFAIDSDRDLEQNHNENNQKIEDEDEESDDDVELRERVILINKNNLLPDDEDDGNYEQSPSKNLAKTTVQSELSINDRKVADDELSHHHPNDKVMKDLVVANDEMPKNNHDNEDESNQDSVLLKYFTTNKSLDENENEIEKGKQEEANEKQSSKIEQSVCCHYEISQDHVENSFVEVIVSELDVINKKKDELQEEFAQLEIERAKLEEELRLMSPNEQNEEVVVEEATFYVSKNEDFAVEKPKNKTKKSNNKMYNEWQRKVEEREARKLHKVIKITKSSGSKEKQNGDDSNVGDEFIKKVKERRRKYTIPSDSDYDSASESAKVPKHINEFLEFSDIQQSSSTEIVKKRDGVWSPQNRSTEFLNTVDRQAPSAPPQPLQPVWVPRSAPQSPTSDRKEFRPVSFESPTLSRRNPPKPDLVSPPWAHPGYEKPPTKSSFPERRLQTSNSLPSISSSTKSQNSTVNILQKASSKDGVVARQVSTIESEFGKKSSSNTSSTTTTTTTTTTNRVKPNEIIYTIKNEYLSEPETQNDKPKKMAQLSPKKIDGIGPTTKEGMPLTLRSEIDENNQAKWYKKMYNTLHKTQDDDDYVTVRYKTRRGKYPYKASGYLSEPEPNYDSDYIIKYSTLDRRRTPSALSSQSYNKFNTLQSGSTNRTGVVYHKNQPGRIENYTPGKSSISDKESKEWWDEVMEIFDGHLEHQKSTNNRTTYEGNLSRALKEQGYESDSTLLFRKKEPAPGSALSPVEQKQFYKSMQAGGEVPQQGFRKLAPEKPKEMSNVPPPPPIKGCSIYTKNTISPESPRRYIESDVNIHYKTPIRYEYKEAIPDDELAYRQAEHMRKVYQDERRRKYMHELEDLQSRRHTDIFPQSEKSPIPLNRYDDFDADLSPISSSLPRTIAKALYNFQGQTARELSFKKGDIIYIRRQIDKNWFEGEHNAMVGLLPANYIEILSKDGVKQQPRKPIRDGKARAKFNFTAQTSLELSLCKGELVTLTRRVDENWFEGIIGNKKGIFPVSYVDVLMDIGSEEAYEIEQISKPITLASHTLMTSYDDTVKNGNVSPVNGIIRETKTVRKTEVLHVDTSNEPIGYRALYNYKPQNSDELELQEGDTVYVLEKCDDGWYVGTSQRTGYFGTFPGNYVRKL